MTTKKERRAQVEEKRERRIAEDKRVGLAALTRSREQRQRVLDDAERAQRSKKTALAMRNIKPDKKVGDITVGDFLHSADVFNALDLNR